MARLDDARRLRHPSPVRFVALRERDSFALLPFVPPGALAVMASFTYNIGSKSLLDRTADFLADTLEILLVTATYAAAANKDDTAGTPAAGEIGAVSGYVPGFGGAGRKVLAGKTITNDTVNDRTVFAATSPSAWTLGTGATVGGAVVQKKGAANDTTAVPLFFLDFADTPTNGSTFTLTYDANGIGYTQQ